ncbi:MAG: hypothetical protein KAX11_09590, partial [Candidatus Aminicenantes bacterium]|nr:hypothetical protein [Candidatus Aminicenantes bacterium]
MSKMSRKVYIAAFILVFAGAAALITASIGPANPASTEKKQVSKSKTIKTLNPKIAAFLKFLDKARSPEEVASAFKKAKFTQKESEQLNLELKKPPYSAKINRFKQMA